MTTTPKREFGQTGKVYRSFQSSWFGRWKWMHYDATNDLAICHLCMMGAKSGKLSSSSESAFIFSGFSTRCFNKYEGSLKYYQHYIFVYIQSP